MAQWDERDPRWLVTEMGKEGSNVNGWHWEEKSKMAWSKSRLSELVQSYNIRFENEKGHAHVKHLTNLKGEAYLTRRKGNKILAVYDLSLTLFWEGQLKEEEEKVTGNVSIEEFCLGSDTDDYLFSATSFKSDDKHTCLIQGIQSLKPQIYRVLEQFDEEIKSLSE